MPMRQREDTGMTVLEILVVIAILGIFMGIAIPSVTRAFRSMEHVKGLTSRYPEARRALGRISDMVRQTYPAAFAAEASKLASDVVYVLEIASKEDPVSDAREGRGFLAGVLNE